MSSASSSSFALVACEIYTLNLWGDGAKPNFRNFPTHTPPYHNFLYQTAYFGHGRSDYAHLQYLAPQSDKENQIVLRYLSCFLSYRFHVQTDKCKDRRAHSLSEFNASHYPEFLYIHILLYIYLDKFYVQYTLKFGKDVLSSGVTEDIKYGKMLTIIVHFWTSWTWNDPNLWMTIWEIF